MVDRPQTGRQPNGDFLKETGGCKNIYAYLNLLKRTLLLTEFVTASIPCLIAEISMPRSAEIVTRDTHSFKLRRGLTIFSGYAISNICLWVCVVILCKGCWLKI